MKYELKPCPFCGGQGELFTPHDSHFSDVECLECDVRSIRCPTEQKAIDAWNMGLSHCGVDSKGRPIGYAFEATCDHPGCNKKIDRGQPHACGGMHGKDVFYCENYFCNDHLVYLDHEKQFVCDDCYQSYLDDVKV